MRVELGRLRRPQACGALAKLAWDRWIAEEEVVVDDITAVAVYLPGHAQYVPTRRLRAIRDPQPRAGLEKGALSG